MNNETVSLLVSKVQELIVAGNGKVEQFFPLAVKQQIIEGWCGIAGGILILIGAIIALITSIRAFKGNEEEFKGGILLLSTVLFVIGLIFVFGNISQILNPEYNAVKALITMATGK